MKAKIYVRTKTIRVRPKETCQIHIGFKNMAPCALRYELEPRDGTITNEGVFTASDKQGIHVIRVLCAHNPLISTFAHVEVRK